MDDVDERAVTSLTVFLSNRFFTKVSHFHFHESVEDRAGLAMGILETCFGSYST
jgi:hypothetical protein